MQKLMKEDLDGVRVGYAELTSRHHQKRWNIRLSSSRIPTSPIEIIQGVYDKQYIKVSFLKLRNGSSSVLYACLPLHVKNPTLPKSSMW